MVVLDGNFALGWGPGMVYPSKHYEVCSKSIRTDHSTWSR